MTDASNAQTPVPNTDKDVPVGGASDEKVRRLAQAIDHLGNDADSSWTH